MFKSIWDDFTHQLRSGNMVTRLIIINIIVFLVINIAGVFFNIAAGAVAASNPLVKFFSVSADFKYFVLHPWGIITHMFTHHGFWHIFWNMVLLYWFGRIVGDLVGDRRILSLYVLGGLAGAALFLITSWIIPGMGNSYAIGASGAVMAVVVAAGFLAPEYRISLILFETQLKYVVAVMVLLDIVGASATLSSSTSHFAHLGGIFFGWFFVYSLKNGSDLSIPFNNFMDRLTDFRKRLFGKKRSRPQPKVAYRNKERIQRQHHNQTPGHHSDSGDIQERVDAILDKIRKHGMGSLTDEERDFLNSSHNKID